MKTVLRPLSVGILTILVGLAGQFAIAGTIWDAGGGGTTNINTAANWDADTLPTLTGGASTLTFGTAGSTATINTAVDVLGILFNRDTAFTLANGAGSLTLGSSGIDATPASLTGTTQINYTISESDLTLGASQTWNVVNNTATTILIVNSAVADGASTFGITKTGAGRLNLAGNNSYDGTTTINVGVVRISSNTALGSTTGATSVASGAALQMIGDITVTGETLTLNGGGVSNAGGALRSISGNNEWAGNITIGAATTRIASDSGLLTISGDINTQTFQTLFQGNGNTTVSGIISGSGSLATSSALGATSVLTLSNANTFTGQMQINRGIVSVSTIKDFDVASSLGAAASSAIVIGQTGSSGTLLYTGTGDTSNRTITIGTNTGTPAAGDTGSATIQNDGSGALVFNATTFNNQTTSTVANRTLTLRGSNAGNNTISGIIRDNAGTTSAIGLIKADSGTWILSGANTYTGATTVSAGVLELSSTGTINNTSQVIVNTGGTLLLGGSQRINDTATVTMNGGRINLSAGITETVGALTLSSSSILDFSTLGGNRSFTFADSSANGWTGTLSIYNYVDATQTQLFFGDGTSTGLTSGQLNTIQFFSGAGSGTLGTATFSGAGGQITPVPEPSALGMVLGLAGLVAWRERRHLLRCREARAA